MGRHAAGGRNWEGFGPDPFLAGEAMSAAVSGVQSVGVQASSKHYVGNEQETQRSSSTADDGTVIEAISSNIDDRTLHELYIWPFANAIKAGTASIMCSYNRLNEVYSCENSELLTNITRDELGFRGYIVSDWYATHSTVEGALAGLDLEMPGPVSTVGASYFGDLLLEAVNNGSVPEARLDEMTVRVLTPYFLLKQDRNFPTVDPATGPALVAYQFGPGSPYAAAFPEVEARDVRRDHANLIREIGAAGTVLLKNVNKALPLTSELDIGIFGNDAPYPAHGSAYVDTANPLGFEVGTIDVGGGSGGVRHTSLIEPMEAIRHKVESIGGRAQFILNNNYLAAGKFNGLYPTPDACLVFLKAFATEGLDREDLDLQWNATLVVENVAAICTNTIVITHGPGVVLMPWADNENVTAILAAHYPGEETGNSIVDVLWGDAEPSGRLPYTIPRDVSQSGPSIVNLTEPVTDAGSWQSDFVERLLIDYRRYDAENIEPLYEFGYGLGYTTFEITNLDVQVSASLQPMPDSAKGIAPGGLVDLWTNISSTTVQVKNIGDRAGYAVPQLYVSFPQDTTPSGTPVKVLRGFEKVFLDPGEARQVTFQSMRRDLSFWDTDMGQWVVPEGTFTYMVGLSSRDLKAEVQRSVL
ncbi:putative beta-glucosidase 2 protein [Phaeoacremonium minimum UCRPA7]|uniref:Probable beta-glucosidase G n=1 Tax=Phaeoacremonium minimum (strain UCR-PA7) TaxID=1286976 RepID=R8BPE3_PHAM7|nr:putative beta-glucosidase 2 protein [Phaeoacremonium minimum UCRPA7]EOO01258.1 putative beta-glucosidase 2 protein [Phaeoacremonium minimum UCRPA7]